MIVRHQAWVASGLLRVALIVAGLVGGGLAHANGAADSSAADAAPAGTQPGVWQTHQSDFWFMGFTSTYSCEGLADKLSLLLKLTGARSDSKVAPVCPGSFDRPDKFAQAKLSFASLQPPAAANAAATVPGVWRHVAWMPHRPFQLDGSDCELMEQFRDKILPMFATRNLNNQIACVPHQDTGDHWSLSFDVFAPVSAPDKH
jgi:hypothetical protein